MLSILFRESEEMREGNFTMREQYSIMQRKNIFLSLRKRKKFISW